MMDRNVFYKLLNEGLHKKYCKEAGPVQEINLTYKRKEDIQVSQIRKVFDTTEIDFIGNFIEEKAIYADLSNPIQINTSLNNVSGTLYIKDNNLEDLIMEFQ
ncbi:MAG: hypothetical protein L6246_00045 [Thermodesulfovibrionales bacterium]|nr:hypothetical protein [Nitrospinota bacterium]MCG2708705.1 hypothetical protein [Thermodesulfovibrionales bacterium]